MMAPRNLLKDQAIRPNLFVYHCNPQAERLQRLRDLVIASVGLVAISPVLCIAAVAILVEDGAPVVFAQNRVGRFGKTFVIFKLRTMKKTELRDELSPRNSTDSRVTAVGRFLRKSSIDELPQLINIVKGEMALVGPRPEMPFVVAKYERWQNLRHLVTPGLTGLWQVEARKTISLERPEATLIDLEYIRRTSFLFDLKIIARTAAALLRPKGAY